MNRIHKELKTNNYYHFEDDEFTWYFNKIYENNKYITIITPEQTYNIIGNGFGSYTIKSTDTLQDMIADISYSVYLNRKKSKVLIDLMKLV